MRIDKNLCARKCCLLAQALPVLAAFLVTSCGIFQGQPALPRNPVGTSSDSSQNQFTAAKARADVVYLEDDREVANSGQNTALKILDALQGHDARMAIGWASVDLTQQPLLNQWQEQKISAEELLARLPSAEVAQMASAGTDLVRQMLRPGIAQLALGCPRDLFTKVRLGEKFSDEERAMIPSGFTAPPNDFENFSDQISDVPRLRPYNIRGLYRACRISEQMAAETIVKYMTENPRTKLLVILRRGYRINPRNVSHYVAEKCKLRQLILDQSGGLAPARPNLLALGAGSRNGWLL